MYAFFWLSCHIQFYFYDHRIAYELCVFLTGHLIYLKKLVSVLRPVIFMMVNAGSLQCLYILLANERLAACVPIAS